MISLVEFNFLVNKIWKKYKFLNYLINLICIFYLFFFIYTAHKIYEMELLSMIFILLICIFSDIGGYTVGKSIGGKKLTKISPNKTISGSIGSFIFSLIPLLIFIMIYSYTKNTEYKPNDTFKIILVSLALSFVCQLGDLFISLFKRKAKVKDTGSIFPGHGGILDRIDGIIFAIPTAFIIDKIFF